MGVRMASYLENREYLHSKRVLYRGMGLDNLLVDAQWNCKVTDFGTSVIRPTVSRSMTCIGTPTYMAPEVLKKEKYSEKADIFSFGIVLYEMFSGHRAYSLEPFKSMNIAVLNSSIISGARPALEDLPVQLQQLVSDCWNQSPERRPHWPEIIARLQALNDPNHQHLQEPDHLAQSGVLSGDEN